MYSQQDAQYTQYMYNMNVINPAYAGSTGSLSIGLLGRTQWMGVSGAPETLTLSMHSPLGNRTGIGFSVIHDEIGPVKENTIYGDFSYTINVSEQARLAFGIKSGVTLLDVDLLSTVDPDPLNEPIHQVYPNFGAGLYFYTNNFYFGFSVPNFLKTRHLENDAGIVSTASEEMHYYLTSGYVFDIGANLKLKPSMLIKAATGSPMSVDLSANALIVDRLEFGLSYRIDDSVSAIVGFIVNPKVKIGYAYDHTVSSFGEFNYGSHEILLLFNLKKESTRKARFF